VLLLLLYFICDEIKIKNYDAIFKIMMPYFFENLAKGALNFIFWRVGGELG